MKLPERITVCEVGLRDGALRGSWATRETAMCCGRGKNKDILLDIPTGQGGNPTLR